MADGPTFAVDPGGVSPFSAIFTNGAIPANAARTWLADPIDPSTGDLVSITTGLHPVDGAICWAFQTRLHTGSALGEAGHLFDQTRKLGDRAERALRLEAERLFAPFVARGWVKLDPTEITVELDTASIVCSYTNLLTRQRREGVRFAIGGTP